MQEEPKASLLDDYLDTEGLAAEFKKAPITIERWRRQGKGPPVTWIGREPFYHRAKAAKWLADGGDK